MIETQSLVSPGSIAALSRALADAPLSLDAHAVADLIAGVVAAPEPFVRDAWLDLVSTTRTPALERALWSVHEELRPFAEITRPDAGRLARVRAQLVARGLDGFIVPRQDEHQGEYVPARAQRLAWLTGFTGSAGAAIVLQDRAVVFADGRYTLQVAAQTDRALFELAHLVETPPHDWLAKHLGAGKTFAYDPWLHTAVEVERFKKACDQAGSRLVAVHENPVDAAWPNQPAAPLANVVPWELRCAGKSSAEKRAEIAADLKARRVDAAVISFPDVIAWLLNVRGGDVECTPLPLGFAIVHSDATVDLFMDARKLAPGTAAHLGPDVRIAPPSAFGPTLDALPKAEKRVQACPNSAPSWVFDRLIAAGATGLLEPLREPDPCMLPKAKKNPSELEGMRASHVRDGASLTRFLCWVAKVGPTGTTDEIAASDKLAAFRRENDTFRGLSFETISGAAGNGAIVHYRSTPETNRPLTSGMLYLVDSGAQYTDGTTDVTRTIAFGTPSAEQKERFTLVLKGHIQVALSRFPSGTTGSQLDGFARRALWQLDLDYDHGTGHGVGCYLGVHEGPHRIAKPGNAVKLEVGMVVSNEPGYYKTGEYGIRIENLVVVTQVGTAKDAPDRPILGFETLTLAPIDRNLVASELLTNEERAWLDAYHARVRDTLTPRVDAETAAWLAEVTEPIG